MSADGVKHSPCAGIVFFFGKVGLQIGVDHLLQRAAGEKVLQTLALQNPVVVVGYGEQDQNAVVLFGGADTPFIEQLRGVVTDIHSLGGGDAGNYHLGAGHGEQGVVAGHDVISRFGCDHVSSVQHVECVGGIGNMGRIISRAPAASGERNQQKYAQKQCAESMFFQSFLPLFINING